MNAGIYRMSTRTGATNWGASWALVLRALCLAIILIYCGRRPLQALGLPAAQQASPATPEVAPPRELSTAEVEQQIHEKLRTEPALANLDVRATVDDAAVLLTGTVDSEKQHELGLRIAKSFVGKRKLLDKINVRESGPSQH